MSWMERPQPAPGVTMPVVGPDSGSLEARASLVFKIMALVGWHRHRPLADPGFLSKLRAADLRVQPRDWLGLRPVLHRGSRPGPEPAVGESRGEADARRPGRVGGLCGHRRLQPGHPAHPVRAGPGGLGLPRRHQPHPYAPAGHAQLRDHRRRDSAARRDGVRLPHLRLGRRARRPRGGPRGLPPGRLRRPGRRPAGRASRHRSTGHGPGPPRFRTRWTRYSSGGRATMPRAVRCTSSAAPPPSTPRSNPACAASSGRSLLEEARAGSRSGFQWAVDLGKRGYQPGGIDLALQLTRETTGRGGAVHHGVVHPSRDLALGGDHRLLHLVAEGRERRRRSGRVAQSAGP